MILVGSTGFVGTNLVRTNKFSSLYHRTNVQEAYGSNPDVLVYAGVTGTKFLANKYPEKDLETVNNAIVNIKNINPQKLILISTVDVNGNLCSDERQMIEKSMFGYYGNHRLMLEKWVQSNISDYNIIRLPAIYGFGLKKNFVYDLIHVIPTMLTEQLFVKLTKDISDIEQAYEKGTDGYFHYQNINRFKQKELRKKFLEASINAFIFTDKDSCYQYYNLAWLWNDIEQVIKNNIKIINLVTQPVKSSELFEKIYGYEFTNKIDTMPVKYDLKTTYDYVFDSKNGYIYNKVQVMDDLQKFIEKSIDDVYNF